MLAIKTLAADALQHPLRIAAVTASTVALAGCLEMRGIHYVNHCGNRLTVLGIN